MSSLISNYYGNLFLHTYLTSRPTWLALHTDDPTVLGDISTEMAGTTRQAMHWSEAASKTVTNSASFTFTLLPAGVVSHLGVWDALNGGHMITSVQLADPITVLLSGHLLGAVGDIAIRL